jgi:hypothetical protein
VEIYLNSRTHLHGVVISKAPETTLLTVYLTTLSTVQIRQRQTIELSMKNKLERMWKEAVVA